MAVGVPIPNRGRPGLATPKDAQDPGSHYGKVLRLNDDGTAPTDNPFAGRPGYKPEIYALGIRNAMGLIVHPETGEIWETENGPQGGDELNIIKAGRNYGWPVISYGRSYEGNLTGDSGPSSEQPVAAYFFSRVPSPESRVPGPLSSLTMKLLAKNAEERYQTASGLEADLRRCLAEWESQGRIDPFPLGAHDASDRFLIPEKLYGREREVEALLAAFDQVVAGGLAQFRLGGGQVEQVRDVGHRRSRDHDPGPGTGDRSPVW